MRDRLLFVTSNPRKVREVEAVIGARVDQLDLDLPEIQALDVTDVARDKARTAYEWVGRSVLVEDTGLQIDALGGLPGALVKWFLATLGPAGICALIAPGVDRGATARTALALCDGGEVEVLTGETRGAIAAEPAGAGGFGWDPIFRPEGSPRTFAEMEQVERNVYSMRRKALERLRERLAIDGGTLETPGSR